MVSALTGLTGREAETLAAALVWMRDGERRAGDGWKLECVTTGTYTSQVYHRVGSAYEHRDGRPSGRRRQTVVDRREPAPSPVPERNEP